MAYAAGGMVRLAYLVSQFPETHESFIVREIQAVTRTPDVELAIFSLKHCRDRIVQDEALPFVRITRYPSPWKSAYGIWTLTSRPGARRCARLVLDAYRGRPKEQAKALGTLVRAGGMMPALRRLGSPHLHAHWATMPALAAYFLKSAGGLRYSITAHAWDIYTDTTMLREKIEAAEFVVTCTGANVEHLRSLAGPGSAIVLSYHGLDFERIPAPRFERRGIASILAVGRLVEQKGFSVLVDACSLLTRRGVALDCRIIGEGPLRGALQGQIRDLGLESAVTLAGALPMTEVFEAYRKATVFCAPSVVAGDGDRDGIPNVILEAMSQGLPVVASRVSGIPEVVRDGDTGWLVSPGDAPSLAQALEQALNEHGVACQRAEGAYQLIRAQFDADRNAAELIEMFRTVSERRVQGRPTAT